LWFDPFWKWHFLIQTRRNHGRAICTSPTPASAAARREAIRLEVADVR
jgi:hypothetical protein